MVSLYCSVFLFDNKGIVTNQRLAYYSINQSTLECRTKGESSAYDGRGICLPRGR